MCISKIIKKNKELQETNECLNIALSESREVNSKIICENKDLKSKNDELTRINRLLKDANLSLQKAIGEKIVETYHGIAQTIDNSKRSIKTDIDYDKQTTLRFQKICLVDNYGFKSIHYKNMFDKVIKEIDNTCEILRKYDELQQEEVIYMKGYIDGLNEKKKNQSEKS